MSTILCYIYPDMADFEVIVALHRLRNAGKRQIITVADTPETVVSQSGLRYVPDMTLTEAAGVSHDLGTRHRAALGVSEMTDAIALIVSEETGITRQGVMNCVKKCEARLMELEEKMGLAKKLETLEKELDLLEALLKRESDNGEITAAVKEQLTIIKNSL